MKKVHPKRLSVFLTPIKSGEEGRSGIYLLEMMKRLREDRLKYRLLIAGEGKMLHTLEKKAHELGVSGQVEFLGFVEDMPSFFRSIDIFLLSSRFEVIELINLMAD